MSARYLIGFDKTAKGVFGKTDQLARTFTLAEALREKRSMPFKSVVIYKLVRVRVGKK